ncbi:MAG TPA: pyridoxal-phosphate dependent enzyme [Thermoanaerobaculia bacterium]|nr:pyridoxal-phosphate dependent enzyme [Thermoanaerobaculia bacterium]
MILPTPLDRASDSLCSGREVWLKREDVHELGAFKWRGALPALECFRAANAAGVVTASTGNHGAAVAWAGRRLGLPVVVFAPEKVSQAKLAIILEKGAEVRRVGRDLDEAKEKAVGFAKERGLPFFEDGAEPAQYEGYRAIGGEILEQAPKPLSAVVAPVGNGALICGIGMAIKERSPSTIVVGVAAAEAPVMALSFEAGSPVACDRMATFADGLAVRVAIPRAVETMRRVVDRMLLVSEREIASAVAAYARCGIRVEGAAAAPLAALPRVPASGPTVLLVSGRNIDEEVYRRATASPGSF